MIHEYEWRMEEKDPMNDDDDGANVQTRKQSNVEFLYFRRVDLELEAPSSIFSMVSAMLVALTRFH